MGLSVMGRASDTPGSETPWGETERLAPFCLGQSADLSKVLSPEFLTGIGDKPWHLK